MAALLVGLALAEGMLIAWLLLRGGASAPLAGGAGGAGGAGEGHVMRVPDENFVRNAHPGVDFRPVYPGWSAEDIDLLQRECYGLRYVYEPFVQFRPLPVKKRFVEITEAGYRAGLAPQPWPPDPQDFAVFVFGGSTTFSYGLANEDTLVACLQRELSARRPDLRVQCYNFGSGYYFSTQERALFESLLLRGVVPGAAVFVDGLNDYYYADGQPELTPVLYGYLAPDIPAQPPPPRRNQEDLARLVESVLDRYQRNLRMVEALAREHDVRVLFVGQPVPFLDFPHNGVTYPVRRVLAGHELCILGYRRFAERAASGAFGSHFLWCGDAFADARAPMYADSVHYSPEGARVLARTIAERALEGGLLP